MDKALPNRTHVLSDGRDVQEVTLRGHGLTAKVLTLGAVVRELKLEGHEPSVVLGYENVASYVTNHGFLGAIVGRYANRLKDGQFQIDGQRFQVDRNDNGNALHGGSQGAWAQIWEIAEQGDDFVTLTLTLPDGHMGFPGQLDIACRYSVMPNATLDIQITAQTDAATLCNLTPHCYFNLDGHADVTNHQLQINSAHYVPVDAAGIPFGRIESSDASMDFRSPRPAHNANLDVSYCFDTSQGLQEHARLTSHISGRSVTVLSNQLGLQVFNAAQMQTPENGHAGTPYGPFCGVAFEPQIWPDAPNQPGFPNAVLRPGETYLNHSQFRFS
ncbi:aldose epimerase family protein [Cognatishimia sp. D5M38]|uniref:Aldose 1-epimerase n=1 Tax=Cognatishimia coralii TaxID=3083254 RepID=A0ABU8QHM3_9RHOB